MLLSVTSRLGSNSCEFVAQSGLLHQGNNTTSEEFKVGEEIVKVDLDPIASRLVELYEPIDDLRWRSD